MALDPGEIPKLRQLLGDTLCALLKPDGEGYVPLERLRAKMKVDGKKLSDLLSLEKQSGLTVLVGPKGVSFGKSWKDGCREGTRPWAAE